MYKNKYLKYKQKYLDAKKLNSQTGGAGKTKKEVTNEKTIIDEIKKLKTDQITKIIVYWKNTYETYCKNNIKTEPTYCEYLNNIINLPDEKIINDNEYIIKEYIYSSNNKNYIIKKDWYSSNYQNEFNNQNIAINKLIDEYYNYIYLNEYKLKEDLENNLNELLNKYFNTNNVKYKELELETVYKLINSNIPSILEKSNLDLLIKFNIVNENDYICNENYCSKQNLILKSFINIFDTSKSNFKKIYNTYNKYKETIMKDIDNKIRDKINILMSDVMNKVINIK